MAMSAEHKSTFVAHHRQWWRLHVMKNSRVGRNTPSNNLFSCLSDGTLDGAPCQWLQPPWHTKHHIPEFSKKVDNFSILVAAFRESKLSGIPLLEVSRIVHFFFGIRQSSTLQSASLTPHVPSSQHFQQAYCISLTWILNLHTAILKYSYSFFPIDYHANEGNETISHFISSRTDSINLWNVTLIRHYIIREV